MLNILVKKVRRFWTRVCPRCYQQGERERGQGRAHG